MSDLHGAAPFSGRELRVVVNTNDPDYEHIYSIEAYDEPLAELLLYPPSSNRSDGTVFHHVSNSLLNMFQPLCTVKSHFVSASLVSLMIVKWTL